MASLGLSELVLVVKDVEISARFYREVVGLIPDRPATREWAWFWAGIPGQRQRLGITRGPLLFEERSPSPPGRRFGPVHFAFEVGRSTLEAHLSRVRGAGFEILGPSRLEWMSADAHYFYDPDGNLVEFWSPDRDSGGA